MRKRKPRIGVFKFSCCAGCEFQLIYFQKHLMETFEAVDIVYCPMLESGGMPEGPFDVALIEGAVTECWQAGQLRKVREESRSLIPIGSCAVCGGVPAIKNTSWELDVEKRVYRDVSVLHSVKASPIDRHVKVDGYVKGCPMGEKDLSELVVSLLLKKKPDFTGYSVCVECKIKGNICVLVAYNQPCMGPVTNAGCGALCPSNNRACYSCWGPMKDANARALSDEFAEMGLETADIRRRFTEFGQPEEEFRAGARKR
ncbi:MAG: oxidoreductase [Deltaproteobacteria bacterium]